MEPFDWKPPCLGPVCYVAGIALVCLSLSFGVGYFAGQRKAANQSMQAENAANIAHGVADATKQQAEKADADLASQAPKLAEARADVVRKAAVLAAARTATTPQPPADPAPIDVAALAPMDRAKDELIAAQKVYITGLESQNATLVISRDAWKATSTARDVENLNLRAANAAKDGLIAGALWKGRLQGLAIGIASGYVTGRIQR